MRGPVERAEKRPGRDGRVGRPQQAAPDAIGDERPHAALVPIPLGDDARPQARREGIDLEVRAGPLDLVEEAEDVRDGHVAQPGGQRSAAGPRRGERLEQAIQRAVLTEEEDLVLAAEVVVEVSRREIGGDGDVAHAGGRVAAIAEDPRRGPQDADAAVLRAAGGAPGTGADRTAVRRMNHCSIVECL